MNPKIYSSLYQSEYATPTGNNKEQDHIRLLDYHNWLALSIYVAKNEKNYQQPYAE